MTRRCWCRSAVSGTCRLSDIDAFRAQRLWSQDRLHKKAMYVRKLEGSMSMAVLLLI